MGPDFWTVFTFFGIPFALGVLGLARGLRISYRGYQQYVTAPGPDVPVDERPTGESDRSWRENVVVGLALVLGAGLLVAHSGRWILRLL